MQFGRMHPGKILVRATNWVGDSVMCVPALQELRKTYPSAHISILARPWVSGLYGRESFCDELIPYEVPRGWQGLAQKWRLANQLRDGKFDLAILFPNSFESAALAWLAQIPVRIGYSRDVRRPFLTHAIPVPRPGQIPPHQRFYYLELLKRAAIIKNYEKSSPIRLSGAPAAAEQGRKRLRLSFTSSPVIGVSPGAAYGGAKRWLPERFAEAAIHIAQEHDAAVAVFGSTEELAICQQVHALINSAKVKCHNFGGGTSLAEFIELAAACDLFLTNDSGPMHIASALGVPVVAVFGATDDAATGPTGYSSRVVRHPVECSPCLLRECPIDHRCMTGVSAALVTNVANALVGISKK